MMMFHVKHAPNDQYLHLHDHISHIEVLLMATVADLTAAIQANTDAVALLATASQNHAATIIDPASLDAPVSQITANTAAVEAATALLAPAPAPTGATP